MAFSGSSANQLATGDFTLPRTALDAGPSGANPNKIWLPLWSGETIHAYDQYNVFENIVTTKSLTGGFSWEFPITGTVGLDASWNAGEELGGYSGAASSTSNSFKVNLDKRPMATYFETDNVDQLITQWDYRSELARQAGQTLANTRDRQLAVALCAACLLSPLGVTHLDGSGNSTDPRGLTLADFPPPVVVNSTNHASNTVQAAVNNCEETSALKILQAIENYFVFMQERDYPTNNVYCVVTPKVFQVIRALGIPRTATNNIIASTAIFGASQEFGGVGAPINAGMNTLSDSLEYMGCRIIKSNHLPGGKNYTTAANNIGSSKYNLRWDTSFDIFGVIFQPEAIAGLSLMGMKVDTVADVRRNTQFTVASMMKGTGIIRPELCQLLVGTNGQTVSGSQPVDNSAEINTRPLAYSLISNQSSTNLSGGFAAEYAQA